MTDSRRHRLQELLKSMARGQITTGDELLRAHGHTGVNRGSEQVDQPAKPEGWLAPVPLESACPGVEQAAEQFGSARPFWLIRRPLADVWPEGRAIAGEYSLVLRGARQSIDELASSVGLCIAADARPEDVLFLDTETCGLTSCTIFLVGLMSFDPTGQDLVFEQFLARDYSEEPAILHALARRLEQARLLVTFNGKSFDMTMIRERWAFHGLTCPWQEPPHLDLLHEARRLWKGRVPNYKLQTLERVFCKRRRAGDIPGHAIPNAYHHFVASRDARQVKDILHHNLLDLLTMAQLLTYALTGLTPE